MSDGLARRTGAAGGQGVEERPALVLLSTVVFPHDVVSVQLGEDDPVAELLETIGEETVVAALLPREGRSAAGRLQDFHSTCVLCRVAQHMQMPGGGVQAVFQGLARARVESVGREGPAFRVEIRSCGEEDSDAPHCNELVVEILDLLREYLARDGSYPEELESILRMNVRGPGRFADLVASYLHFPLRVKRAVAHTLDPERRLALVVDALRSELGRCGVDAELDRRVRQQMEQRQREHYLRQQMRAIRRELGEEGSPEEEGDALREKLEKAGMPKEAKTVAEREIARLRSVSQSSAEFQVISTYVGWLLEIPWRKRTRDRLDPERARQVLDDTHSGLDKVKERILEHLAVRRLKRDTRGPILCLVGPPGVGKTSLGKAVAQTLGRRFVRMSVGGLRDEAEIKGHRRTYVGAMPGKVVQLMKRAGVRNPVLQIDEIDKMGSDHRGDPASAILEVLDPEVNAEFRDHYLDIGYDLSEVFFLVTANVLDTIPAALRDRLEILRIGGYTREEKLLIARNHLVPKALEEHGLESKQLRFTRTGIGEIIDGHSREAGLRELERGIQAICRKVARRVVEGEKRAVSAGQRRVRELLGPPRYRPDLAGRRPAVGVATGLAWTAWGGALLTVEANRMPGKGRILVTGRLGEVMQESAQAALSYVRAHADEFEISSSAFLETDIHIHFAEGAIPKDGPSAGVAVATCLASLFTGRAVRHDLAMTGEVTLKGRVLEVGGIKEKLLAAHRAGIRRVLIPADNLNDLEEVPEEIRKDLEIVGSEDVMTNICEALLHVVLADPADLGEIREESELRARPRG